MVTNVNVKEVVVNVKVLVLTYVNVNEDVVTNVNVKEVVVTNVNVKEVVVTNVNVKEVVVTNVNVKEVVVTDSVRRVPRLQTPPRSSCSWSSWVWPPPRWTRPLARHWSLPSSSLVSGRFLRNSRQTVRLTDRQTDRQILT